MERAALVTGGSSGIGLAIARMLHDEGFDLTLVSRRAEKVEAAAKELGAVAVAADVSDADDCARLVAEHRDRFGRLDVLVNSAGVGIGGRVEDLPAKHLDLQLGVNLRAIVLFYRECLDLLRAAAKEHRNALVLNMASIAGKSPQPWLSVYSATKAAVIAYSQAMNKELGPEGIKSSALCPGFVDTDMTEFVKGSVPPEEMLRTTDIAEALRFLLRVSPNCVVPEIIFQRPSETI